MRTTTFKNNWLTSLALLLTFPAAYFILIGILSEMGINGPLESIKPLAEKWGIKDGPGLNITSVIVFGPMVAFLLTIFQFMKLEWRVTSEEFLVHFSFYKRWFPIIVAGASVVVLGMLFLYVGAENCNC
ncbi:MAG TPA: hypothetical protein VFP97_03990 [Chitinophagaceae bacterium]|nr:hypothetical protein [Chitinophagaceae bacterium]